MLMHFLQIAEIILDIPTLTFKPIISMHLLQNTLSCTVMIVNYILLDNVQNQSSEDKDLFLSLICEHSFPSAIVSLSPLFYRLNLLISVMKTPHRDNINSKRTLSHVLTW